MAISTSGIGSGIDINSLVSQLVAAEGEPATQRLNIKEARLQSNLSAVGSLKSALSQFQTAVSDLNDPDLFQARKAESSNSDIFTIDADTDTVAGNYSIDVIQLSQAEKRISQGFSSSSDIVGTGTLDVALGSDTFQLTLDASNSSLEGIRDAINSASDNPGISASILNVDDGLGGTEAKLVLTSSKSGEDNTISITATDDNNSDGFDLTRLDTANLSMIQAAQDAVVKVDGQTASSSTNSLSGIISGVTLTLKGVSDGQLETATISLDKTKATANVTKFVAAYNALTETVSALGAYDAETGQAGGLQGDATLRSLQSQIRQISVNSIPGFEFGSLAELGIVTGASGKLEIDNEKLEQAVDNDLTSISQLFTSDNGLAAQFNTLVDGYIGTEGSLNSQSTLLQSRIDSISGDREKLTTRLTVLEARYNKQFTAMDLLVSQLNGVGSFLTQQLSSISLIGANK